MFRFFRRKPKYSIGIDFGTTTSRLSYIDNTANVNVPPVINPIRSLVRPIPKPSASPHKFEWEVGDSVIDREHFSLFKLDIGNMHEIELSSKRTPVVRQKPIKVRSEILAARVMWQLYQEAVNSKRELCRFQDVVITVPAEWNAIQRQATIIAGRIAGFSQIYLIEEPIAAYLAVSAYYPNDQLQQAQNIMVFDYGGGTLDITIVHRPEQGLPYVVGRSMSKGELGGEIIDIKLCKKVFGAKKWNSYSERDQRYLANIIRQMKESLNPEPGKKAMLNAIWPQDESLSDSPDIIKQGELVLSGADIDAVLEPVTEKIKEYLKAAIENTNNPQLTKNDIEAVILVGGSSYLHKVQRAVEGFFLGKQFGKGIYLEQPEKVVAFGAALYKSYIDLRQKKFTLHVPMHTYLEYKDDQGKHVQLPLDDLNDRKLPIISKPPKTCPVPKGVDEISWNVYQKHTYSEDPLKRDLVERVVFDKMVGSAERLRLEYEIDMNGCLSKWRPVLIFHQKTDIETGAPRSYDWQNIEPNLFADEYGVRIRTKI